jgi:hypothetical protein
MSILADFFALVGPALDGRAYRNAAPDNPITPYAVFQRLTASGTATLDRNGGSGNATNTRIQLDVYSLSGSELDARIVAVKDALLEWDNDNVVLLEQDFYETDTKLHRTMLDISIWHL